MNLEWHFGTDATCTFPCCDNLSSSISWEVFEAGFLCVTLETSSHISCAHGSVYCQDAWHIKTDGMGFLPRLLGSGMDVGFCWISAINSFGDVDASSWKAPHGWRKSFSIAISFPSCFSSCWWAVVNNMGHPCGFYGALGERRPIPRGITWSY